MFWPFTELYRIFDFFYWIQTTLSYIPQGKWFYRWIEPIGVLCVLAILGYFNWRSPGLQTQVEDPLKRVWLPLLALLVYVSIRLTIFILAQLAVKPPQFEDIDEAIEQGIHYLRQARIDLGETPLFLVVGMDDTDEAAFAELPGVASDVRVDHKDLCIHWYASRQAIWVTMPGVSALAQQTRNPQANHAFMGNMSGEADAGVHSTLMPGAISGTLVGAAAPPKPVDNDSLASDAGGWGGTLIDGGSSPPPRPSSQPAPPPKESSANGPVGGWFLDRPLCARRVAYFCDKLKAARTPVCPANGVLVVIPYSWMLDDRQAVLSDPAKDDVGTLYEHLDIRCTTVTMLSKISASEGFSELLNRLKPTGSNARLGCGFPQPSLCRLEPEDLGPIHDWMSETLETHVFSLLSKKPDATRNDRLLQLLDEFRQSKKNFRRVIQNSFPVENRDDSYYFAGVYFGELGKVGSLPSPLAAGVLERLSNEHEKTISWNRIALDEDQRQHRWANMMLIMLVTLTLADAFLALAVFGGFFGWKPAKTFGAAKEQIVMIEGRSS